MATGPHGRRIETKAYLGDGCYVSFDGWALWLTAEDGLRATDTICLEPEVFRAFIAYVGRLEQKPPNVGQAASSGELRTPQGGASQ